MFCSKCGKENDDEAKFCQQCGFGLQPILSGTPINPPSNYAGFWIRLLAALIDGLPFSLIFFLIAIIVPRLEISPFWAIVWFFICVVISWLYFTLLESSVRQATVGKMAVGLIVTDLSGNRISFGRANGRYWGKIVSSLILEIGFIMAGFTKKKQGLHDIMAGTLVIKKGLKKAARNRELESTPNKPAPTAEDELESTPFRPTPTMEKGKKPSGEGVKKGQLIGGYVLVALGILFILDRLLILEIYISWPLILVAFGVGFFVSNPHGLVGWLVGGIGVVFFMVKCAIAFFPEANAWIDLVWPAILFILGCFFVYRYFKPN